MIFPELNGMPHPNYSELGTSILYVAVKSHNIQEGLKISLKMQQESKIHIHKSHF